VPDDALLSVCQSSSWAQLLTSLSTCLPAEPSSQYRLPKALVASVLHRVTSLATLQPAGQSAAQLSGDSKATGAPGSASDEKDPDLDLDPLQATGAPGSASDEKEDMIDCLAVMDLLSLHLSGTSEAVGR